MVSGSSRRKRRSILSAGLELLLQIARELVHYLVGLALDHAVAERGELAENVDVGAEKELGAIAVAGETDFELDLHAAPDLAVAAGCLRLDGLELAALEHVDLHRELDTERPYFFRHRGGITFPRLDRAGFFAAGDA